MQTLDIYVVSQNSCLLIIESQLMRHLIIRDINISGIERLLPFLLSGKFLSSICRYDFRFVAAIQQIYPKQSTTSRSRLLWW